MSTQSQLITLFIVWGSLTIAGWVLDLPLIAHFNNGVVLAFCCAAVWFFSNDDE